jgi:hypothetical protein
MVLISGVVQDPSGAFPNSGVMKFVLSKWIFDADGNTLSPSEVRAQVQAGGAWSIELDSLTDATPSDANYTATFHGVIRGIAVTINFGTFSLNPLPVEQRFEDLIAAGLAPPSVIGTLVLMETPTGVADGSNATFVLGATPRARSVTGYIKMPGAGFYSVMERDDGGGGDFTVTGRNCVLEVVPIAGTQVRFTYQEV